jgi:hypothetical protein
MSMPGIGEPSAQVLVYGPDGTMYPNPAAARAAGVTNYTMQPPAPGGGMPAQPILPPQQQMPMPMQPLQMPSSMQMPSMNLQAPEFGIVDPTYMAQLEILNQGGMNQPMGMPMGQPMGLLGSGLGPQERGPVTPFLTIPNYRPMAQSFRREAAAAGGGMSGGGGGGGDGFGGGNMGGGGGGFSGRGIGADNLAFGILGATSGPLGKFSPIGALANYGAGQYLDARTDYIGGQDFGLLNNVPGGMGTFADEYGNVGTYSSPATIAAQDEAIFGFSPGMGYMSDNSIETGDGNSSQSSNDGTYCCSRMVDLNLWSEHKQLARMHVWHHKQAKWWRAGYSVWGKVVANTLFKKKGFWTDVMDDFYNYHVKNKPRTLKSTVGDLVIYPGVAVCSLFVQEAPATTRYVAQ